jgi:cytochrome b6-f complex iron-sulfur subunit
MADTYQVVTKVWIAPGCIVCDSCENDCPEVFDVQEETCVIRPPAAKPDYLNPLTPTIIVAAEGCPVDVIKFETKEVAGEAPWTNEPAEAVAAAHAGGETHAKAPAPGKAAAPLGPPDPRFQALLTTSKISPSLSAGLASTIRRSPQVNQAAEIIQAVRLPRHAPADQRLAMLAAGGAYQPSTPMAQRVRQSGSKASRVTRRHFNMALTVGWGCIAAVTGLSLAMFQDFFGPKALKEPKKLWRIGRPEDYSIAGVYENYKRTPDGSAGFWVVNLADEKRLVAISTICTHLGCIPNWLAGESKFKCPCHGSGYYITGVNFEGPTPRPLERFAISRDADGYVVVDMTRVYRQELGQWTDSESFVALV